MVRGGGEGAPIPKAVVEAVEEGSVGLGVHVHTGPVGGLRLSATARFPGSVTVGAGFDILG